MGKHVLGSQLVIRAEYRNSSGVLEDVVSAVISIEDPTETEAVTSQTMTKESTGIYYYVYTPVAVGSYCAYVLMTNNSGSVIAENQDFVIMPKYR